MDDGQCKRIYQEALKGLTGTKLALVPLDFDRAIKSENLSIEEVRRGVHEMLHNHPEDRSEGTVEALMYIAGHVGPPSDYGSILATLLLSSNHSRHEDIAHALQVLRYPHAVNALFKAAQMSHDYLNYDDSFGLARKCTWALADIGTPEAFGKLQLLADGDNPTIAGYAQKRLDSWNREKHRKPL